MATTTTPVPAATAPPAPEDGTTGGGHDGAGRRRRRQLRRERRRLSIGSNYSNELPQAGLAAAVAALPNADVTVSINEVDHNTFQENITTYLQNPDDVIPWFAGYRMRFFAAQGLLGDITDVWDAGLNDQLGEGFKVASTGDDGKQYFVPWTYYIWGIYYRPSVFEENGWTPPTNLDELMSLSSDMLDAGITPFAFANDGRWPAMGTFDQLNFRLNGYQFHVDLMAGNESWTDERVKNVFTDVGDAAAVPPGEPERADVAGSRSGSRQRRSRHDDDRHVHRLAVPRRRHQRPRLLRVPRARTPSTAPARSKHRSTAG